MTDEDLAIFAKLSGGLSPPEGGTDEVLAVVGRRGGKSETIARWVTFECLHGGHEAAGAPGQTLVAALVAPEIKHAEELIGYMRGLAALPSLKRHVAKVTGSAVTFRNGIEARIITANEQAVAATYVCLVVDEEARLPGPESAVPDRAIIGSILPGMAPIRGAPRRKFVGITSCFVESGLAYETDRDCFGKADAPTLVLRGSTEKFNPAIDRAWLERQRRKDPLAAMREHGDGDTPPVWMPSIVEGWFGAATVAACVDKGRAGSLAWEPDVPHFVTCDAAFSSDNFAVAVAKNDYSSEPRRTIIAHVEAMRPPPGGVLSPRACVDRVVEVMRRYRAETVRIDQFSSAMLIEAFRDRGVRAILVPWTGSGANAKAAKFRDCREAMRDALVRLPEDPLLVREFHRIRGHMTQSGHESIAASGKGSDDRVSAVVMAVGAAREGDEARRDRVAFRQHAADILESMALLEGNPAAVARERARWEAAIARERANEATPEARAKRADEWERICKSPPRASWPKGPGGYGRGGLW
jgi:hypothetical protein